ncbi:MAG: hypothetical protein KDA91_14755 [Planctomycetaceae bacterium]|nr:hypothetical protein [Planctomycetaceae bacterium]
MTTSTMKQQSAKRQFLRTSASRSHRNKPAFFGAAAANTHIHYRNGRNPAALQDALTNTAHGGCQTVGEYGLFGPLFHFLNERTGKPWQRVARELRLRFAQHQLSEAQIRILASDFVDFHVDDDGTQLRFSEGLLAGQPLISGWRRRLFVCPRTGLLKPLV